MNSVHFYFKQTNIYIKIPNNFISTAEHNEVSLSGGQYQDKSSIRRSSCLALPITNGKGNDILLEFSLLFLLYFFSDRSFYFLQFNVFIRDDYSENIELIIFYLKLELKYVSHVKSCLLISDVQLKHILKNIKNFFLILDWYFSVKRRVQIIIFSFHFFYSVSSFYQIGHIFFKFTVL